MSDVLQNINASLDNSQNEVYKDFSIIFLIIWLMIGCIFSQLNLVLYFRKQKKSQL